MANEVELVKIVTDFFEDEKMMLIENMPEGNSIIVVWIKLLCMAGRQNNGGVIMLNDKMACTEKTLSVLFRRPINTIRLALRTFEMYGMIEIVDGVITIPNWEKYQSLGKRKEGKEKNRLRVAEHRRRQKLLAERCNDYSYVTVTGCNDYSNVTVML